MADLEAVLSAIFHKSVELDLTRFGNIFEEVLDNNYIFTINNNYNKYLDILINNNRNYAVYYDASDEVNYQNFSVVSNKLNQPTE